jgi:hypothetical protein
MTDTLDLVATFPHRSDVRPAVLDLERHGAVDADRIDLDGLVDTTEELGRRAADREVMADFGKRSLAGAGLGAAIGALLAGGITLLTGVDPQPAAPLAAAAGGAGFGGAAGFFYGIASRTPVTEAGLESAAHADGEEEDGPATIVIHLPDDEAATLVEDRLRQLGAQQVDRRARTAGS